MKHVLVTGANGFIGNVLCEKLLAAGHRVTGLDWMIYGEEPLAPLLENPLFRLLPLDVREVERMHLEGIDAVCDLAAVSNDPAGDLDTEITRSINFEARERLALLAKSAGVQRYLLASSCSVYGAGHTSDCREDATLNPLTEYARCNRSAEEALLALNSDGFTVTAFRNATVFGLSRRMRFDLALNIMTLNATTQGSLHVDGDGSQNRPMIHVSDVSRAMVAALAAPKALVSGEVFNLSACNVTIAELAGIIRDTVPSHVEVHYSPRDADNRDYRVDATKVERVLGFTANMTLADGVREVHEAILSGKTGPGPYTRTLDVYRSLLHNGQLDATRRLNGTPQERLQALLQSQMRRRSA